MQAAVIGSGVGGLAIAIRLALKGYQVTVFEKNEYSGGKMAEISGDGFRFDAGPSLFTLPELAEELFSLAGKKMSDHVPYDKLDNICSYFYEDGTKIRAFGDPRRFTGEVEEQTGEPAENVRAHLRKSRTQYDLTADIFLFNSLHRLSTYTRWKVLNSILQIYKVDTLTSMHRRNAMRFRDERVIQLFDRYATYNGSNPYIAPATLNVISHLEHCMGAYFPKKGIRALATGLENLARECGVNFRFNTEVQEVVTDKRRVLGLTINETTEAFDVVVSDTDINYFYRKLMPSSRRKRIKAKNLSTSALIFYWGIKGEYPSLGLHNILFSADYKREFEYLFEKQSICDDPTTYLFISSKNVAGDAPPGHENWFTMINVPPNTGQSWHGLIEMARMQIIRKINRMLDTDIEPQIVFEEVGSPLSIERNTMSWKGALYGNNSNSVWSAFLRHPYRHRSIKNLYFVGGSVHPGGGIPLCLASARIVDQNMKP